MHKFFFTDKTFNYNDDIIIINGDCLDIIPEIANQEKVFDLVLTDPPYGMTQSKWDVVIPFDKMWSVLDLVTKDTTPICLFGVEPFSSHLRCSNINHFKYDWIWDKIKETGFLNVKRQPMRYHEIISTFYKKQCVYNPIKTTGYVKKTVYRSHKLVSDAYNPTNKDTYYQSTVRYPRTILIEYTDKQKISLHPNQKPIKLLEYFIKTYTNEGDLVLDFTSGSGSTAIACYNTKRRCVCIEKDPDIYKSSTTRLHNHILNINDDKK